MDDESTKPLRTLGIVVICCLVVSNASFSTTPAAVSVIDFNGNGPTCTSWCGGSAVSSSCFASGGYFKTIYSNEYYNDINVMRCNPNPAPSPLGIYCEGNGSPISIGTGHAVDAVLRIKTASTIPASGFEVVVALKLGNGYPVFGIKLMNNQTVVPALDGVSIPASYNTAVSAQTGSVLSENLFYHIVVSQTSGGNVFVFVNGDQYGNIVSAGTQGVLNFSTNFALGACNDYAVDAEIFVGGFFTENINATTAGQLCLERENLSPRFKGMCDCGAFNHTCISGQASQANGDPHQTLWNGAMITMGGSGNFRQEYYYVTRCHGNTMDEMPFNILAKHNPSKSSWFHSHPRVLAYVVVELFDWNGDYYMIWLDGMNWRNLYTPNPVPYGTPTLDEDWYYWDPRRTGIPSGLTNIGQRFSIDYSFSWNSWDSSFGRTVVLLYIDGNYVTEITMQGGSSYPISYYPMNAFIMTPPIGFEHAVCGLLGDFKSPKEWQVIPTCDGGYTEVHYGFDFTNPNYLQTKTQYSPTGLSWEKSFCYRGPPIRRRGMQSINSTSPPTAVPSMGPSNYPSRGPTRSPTVFPPMPVPWYNLTAPHVCPKGGNMTRYIENECNSVLDRFHGLGNGNLGQTCYHYYYHCVFDACHSSDGNLTLIAHHVRHLANHLHFLNESRDKWEALHHPNRTAIIRRSASNLVSPTSAPTTGPSTSLEGTTSSTPRMLLNAVYSFVWISVSFSRF